jgi:hypothetical protein
MRIKRERMKLVTTILLGMEVAFFSIFLLSRPALTADDWAVLERQRPHYDGSGTTMSVVADGLNFALAHREIGGWETPLGGVFMLTHLPALLTAMLTFNFLQAIPVGSSKLNSDLATAVFVAIAIFQWLCIASIISMSGTPARKD